MNDNVAVKETTTTTKDCTAFDSVCQQQQNLTQLSVSLEKTSEREKRALLKNLAQWLGTLTLARDRPIEKTVCVCRLNS